MKDITLRLFYLGAILVAGSVPAFATGCSAPPITLTTAGTSLGFTLSTFACGFTTNNASVGVGPIGIAFSGSNVLVSDYFGPVYSLANTDGQNVGSLTPTADYGVGNGTGLATLFGVPYLAQQSSGNLVKLNADGSANSVLFSGLGPATGIAANPTSGLLYVSNTSSGQILALDPVGISSSVFQSGRTWDGLTVDVVHQILYAAGDNHVFGYRLSDGAQILDTGTISGGPDGVALGQGALGGKLLINNNDGSLVLYDIAGNTSQVVASGGTRGDFVAVDANGSLLITQSDHIVRLTAGEGASFGDAPEPGTVTTLIGGLGALALAYRRRRV